MTRVVIKDGKTDFGINFGLKRFKRETQGLSSEIKKREHYDKPGVRRRKRKAEAIKNFRKRNKNIA